MRFRFFLILYAGASLLLVGSAVIADDDDALTAPAMQIMIDTKTGKKMENEDDAGVPPSMATNGVTAPGRRSSVASMIPERSQAPQYHADGTVSARIGLEHFKYLVVTKDSNGEQVFTHVPADQLDLDALPAASDLEEE